MFNGFCFLIFSRKNNLMLFIGEYKSWFEGRGSVREFVFFVVFVLFRVFVVRFLCLRVNSRFVGVRIWYFLLWVG